MASFNDRRDSEREVSTLPVPSQILSSQWGDLSQHLIAKFYPVKRMKDGKGWEQSRDKHEIASSNDRFAVDDGYEVHAPISDGVNEMTLNWNSPFENAGAESKAPMLSAMLQAGTLATTLQAFATTGILSEEMQSMAQKSSDFLRSIEGRTGITKLNSTQIFTGMPPSKQNLTLHFRALSDPVAEVRDPIQQLKEWAVPQLLSQDGLIAGALGSGTLVEAIYPSKTPQIIGMKYGDGTFMPMVIEHVSDPFTNPRNDKGVMLSCSVQIVLATLTALDRRDIQAIYR